MLTQCGSSKFKITFMIHSHLKTSDLCLRLVSDKTNLCTLWFLLLYCINWKITQMWTIRWRNFGSHDLSCAALDAGCRFANSTSLSRCVSDRSTQTTHCRRALYAHFVKPQQEQQWCIKSLLCWLTQFKIKLYKENSCKRQDILIHAFEFLPRDAL